MKRIQEFLDSDEFKKFRKVQMRLLKEFQHICAECGIEYFAALGTLLGTIRHKGFIPWDDDLDLWIWRKDLLKLKEYIQEKDLSERFVFEDDAENYYCSVIKFVDVNTTNICFDSFSMKGNYGIAIDILCLNFTYSDEFLREEKHKKLDLFYETLYFKIYGKSQMYYESLEEEQQKRILKLAQEDNAILLRGFVHDCG